MDPLIIPIVGMAIPLVIVPVALGMKHARRERELEHAERMRALELGSTLPQDEPWWTPGRLGLALGLGVPLGVFACAALATAAEGYHAGIWLAAAVVGSAGVVWGSDLAARGSVSREAVPAYSVKPSVEEDAFDVAGARG
ncbi:MAG: hypothetical protein P4L84_00990 [Isosphaeraceae bacterium]|nr:hypothetical protein [Isosphaeraceae bacterium]